MCCISFIAITHASQIHSLPAFCPFFSVSPRIPVCAALILLGVRSTTGAELSCQHSHTLREN